MNPSAAGRGARRATRDVKLELRALAWRALEEEAGKLGMTVEELVGFSVMYYLADRDAGRVARRVTPDSTQPEPAEPGGGHPLEKLLGD